MPSGPWPEAGNSSRRFKGRSLHRSLYDGGPGNGTGKPIGTGPMTSPAGSTPSGDRWLQDDACKTHSPGKGVSDTSWGAAPAECTHPGTLAAPSISPTGPRGRGRSPQGWWRSARAPPDAAHTSTQRPRRAPRKQSRLGRSFHSERGLGADGHRQSPRPASRRRLGLRIRGGTCERKTWKSSHQEAGERPKSDGDTGDAGVAGAACRQACGQRWGPVGRPREPLAG